jgi:hypothetical protein
VDKRPEKRRRSHHPCHRVDLADSHPLRRFIRTRFLNARLLSSYLLGSRLLVNSRLLISGRPLANSRLPISGRPCLEPENRGMTHTRWTMMTRWRRTPCSTLRMRGRWSTLHWRLRDAYTARIEREQKRGESCPRRVVRGVGMGRWPRILETRQSQGQHAPFRLISKGQLDSPQRAHTELERRDRVK